MKLVSILEDEYDECDGSQPEFGVSTPPDELIELSKRPMSRATFIKKLRKFGEIPNPSGHVKRRKGITSYFFDKDKKPGLINFLLQCMPYMRIEPRYVYETILFTNEKVGVRPTRSCFLHDIPEEDWISVSSIRFEG